MTLTDCRFGYVEYDGDQYCFEHGGFRSRWGGRSVCDQAVLPPPATSVIPPEETP